MNVQNWGGHAIVCMAVCLMLLCGTITREAEETVAMQGEWTDEAQSQEEKREVIAVNEEIHTQVREETADTVCLPTGNVTREFGWQEEDGIWRYHGGVDIAYTQGESVRAVMGGTVYWAERVAEGHAVEVTSGGELWRYEPLAEVSTVVGEHIKAGTVLGTVGGGGVLHIGRQRDGEWLEPISMQN